MHRFEVRFKENNNVGVNKKKIKLFCIRVNMSLLGWWDEYRFIYVGYGG